MKFGKILKNIILPSCLFTTAIFFGGDLYFNNQYARENRIIVSADEQERIEVNIQSTVLKNKLLDLLGKESTDKLYADDFMINDHYKAVTAPDPDSGVDVTTAERNCLDLSNTGIVDITELIQFEFPTTLKAIDLSGNGITNEHLNQLSIVSNMSYETTPTYTYTTSFSTTILDVRCNFFVNLEKINLSINNIELSDVDLTSNVYNTFIFGVQNLPDYGTSTLIPTHESGNAKYYLRSTDTAYLTITTNITYEDGTSEPISTIYNTIAPLINTSKIGEYQIKIQNPPLTASGYFHGLDKILTFNLFKISIDPSFTIERRDFFIIPKDRVTVEGLGTIGQDYDINTNVTKESTQEVGTKNATIVVSTTDGRTRNVTLGIKVIDTTAPIITLEGGSVTYLSRNNEFIDPGYTATDNGEPITSLVVVDTSNLKIFQNGVYQITYNVTDRYGNKATEVVRTIKVEEHVLDRITIKCLTETPTQGKNIEFEISPNSGINIADYKDFEYKVYLDGIIFQTIKGDSATGKAYFTLNLSDINLATLKASLVVTRTTDNTKMEVISQPYNLELAKAENPLQDNLLLIGGGIAGIVLIIILFSAGIRKSKKGKTHSKKKSKPEKKSSDAGVQIIKDYSGSGNSSAFENAMNSQPHEFRPEDTIPQNNFNPMNTFEMNELSTNDTSGTPLGKIDVAKIPADQAINGGTQPNAGIPNNTNNTNNNNDDIWF